MLAVVYVGCSTLPRARREAQAQGYLALARTALLENRANDSLQYISLAKTLQPDSAAILHAEAVIFFTKKNYSKALESVLKALSLDPTSAAFHNTAGRIYVELKDYVQAEKHLQQAIDPQKYAEAFKALTSLGMIAYRNNKMQVAREYFNKAIQEDAQQACIAYSYRGHIYLKERNFSAAIQDYTTATQKTCYGLSDAWLALGIAYYQSGKYHKAQQVFYETRKLYPDTAQAKKALEYIKRTTSLTQ